MEKSYQKFFESVGTKIENIQKDMDLLTKSQIEEKYKDFREQHPKLWNHTMAGSVNLTEYRNLVKLQGMVLEKSNGTSKEKIFNSSVEVGEALARKYLYPDFKEPTKEEKDKAYQQALSKVSR